MILFDSNYLKLEFKNVPCRHLVASWHGSPGDDMYQQGCTTIFRCCHENGIRKLVSDIRLQERISAKAEAFGQKAIAEYIAQHGRLYHAVVLSSDIFLKFDVANFDIAMANKNHVQQLFSSPQDAIAWLQDIDANSQP